MRIGAALLALCLTGCSLMFTRGPTPAAAPHVEPQCTTSSAAPILDIGGALVWVLGIASVQSLSGLPGGDEPDARQRQRTTMIMFGGLAGLHVVSMVVGSGRIGRCKKAREAWLHAPQRSR
jgi:hypothetical protein